jgi:hypothetical protein
MLSLANFRSKTNALAIGLETLYYFGKTAVRFETKTAAHSFNCIFERHLHIGQLLIKRGRCIAQYVKQSQWLRLINKHL